MSPSRQQRTRFSPSTAQRACMAWSITRASASRRPKKYSQQSARSSSSAPLLFPVDACPRSFFGVHRVTNAFLPLLEPGGRVVMISSGSAPMFVAKCSPERQAFFRNPVLTWMQIKEAADLFLAVSSDAAKLAEAGFPAPNQCGLPDAYGASKAFLNSYTMHLARVQSSIKTNACSPGFIVTDLVSKSLADPAKAGALPPSAGAVAPLYLLTSPDVDNGVYYGALRLRFRTRCCCCLFILRVGSDAKRSPLHKYRSPGTPAYTGEDD